MSNIASVKRLFFDKKTVLSAVDVGTRKVLSKFGAFVARRSQTSLRRKKGTSAPGTVPYSHTDKLRDGILFSFDPATRSVVIGPIVFGAGTAPRLLERGGVGTVNGHRAVYPRRPFMRPAFDAELGKVAPEFKGMFKR